jgi:hypothetical protein
MKADLVFYHGCNTYATSLLFVGILSNGCQHIPARNHHGMHLFNIKRIGFSAQARSRDLIGLILIISDVQLLSC